MTKIELNRLNDGYHFEAANEDGDTIHLDASADIGGAGKGMRPMQVLLAATGGCSAIDIINILKKQRQDLKDLKITVNGERQKDVTPALYETVHIHYRFFGNLDAEKVEKAINLSLEKYCSVSRTLEKAGATVTSTYEIIPAESSSKPS